MENRDVYANTIGFKYGAYRVLPKKGHFVPITNLLSMESLLKPSGQSQLQSVTLYQTL